MTLRCIDAAVHVFFLGLCSVLTFFIVCYVSFSTSVVDVSAVVLILLWAVALAERRSSREILTSWRTFGTCNFTPEESLELNAALMNTLNELFSSCETQEAQ